MTNLHENGGIGARCLNRRDGLLAVVRVNGSAIPDVRSHVRIRSSRVAATSRNSGGKRLMNKTLLPGRALMIDSDASFTLGGIRNNAVGGALTSARRGYAVTGNLILVSWASNSQASAAPRRTLRRSRLSRRGHKWDNTMVSSMTSIIVNPPDWVQPASSVRAVQGRRTLTSRRTIRSVRSRVPNAGAAISRG